MGCRKITYHEQELLGEKSKIFELGLEKSASGSKICKDYYAFGSLMPARSFSSNSYRYGFNGKEKLDEIDNVEGSKLDFGARVYDSRLGKWMSVDPLTAMYPSASPYNFALNTPIQAIDPDGNLVIFVNGYTQGFAGLIGLTGDRPLSNTGMKKYWGGLDDDISKKIGDENRYYSHGGTRTAWSTAQERYNQGTKEGKAMLEKINAGDIIIKVDENGNPTETIKIVSHSQGSAKAAGISNVLTEAGYSVEVEYNIAPKQPGDIPKTSADRVVQYGSEEGLIDDFIAPQSSMGGADEQYELSDEKKTILSGGGHGIEQYGEILDIPKGNTFE